MISPHAIVQTSRMGANVAIGEFSIVRSDVVLGNDVVVHPHSIINSGAIIGDNVEIFPGTVIGKEPKGAGALSRAPVFERRVVIAAGCSIGPHAVIFYDVEIGESTLVGDGASIREGCRIGSRCLISRYVTVNYETTIGDRTKVMDNTHLTGKCRIGDDVFISAHVAMANDRAGGKHGYVEEEIRGPAVDNGAVIGIGAILLPGVHIGAEALVAAGAVVSKDVEPKSLVVGVPARFVKRIA